MWYCFRVRSISPRPALKILSSNQFRMHFGGLLSPWQPWAMVTWRMMYTFLLKNSSPRRLFFTLPDKKIIFLIVSSEILRIQYGYTQMGYLFPQLYFNYIIASTNWPGKKCWVIQCNGVILQNATHCINAFSPFCMFYERKGGLRRVWS